VRLPLWTISGSRCPNSGRCSFRPSKTVSTSDGRACPTTERAAKAFGGAAVRAATARRTGALPPYGMNSGPLSVNALRNSRIAPIDCVVSCGQVIDFVHAVAANWAGIFVSFSKNSTW
jgi:hypothetical protein